VYLKKNITGLDILFSEAMNPLIKKVRYGGGHFPFPDNEFDVIISVDSLEHIGPEDRPGALDEMLRVAGRAAIIMVPCGRKAYEHDRELAAYYKRVHGRSGKFFDDHLCNGLPEEEELKRMLEVAAKKNNKNITIRSIPFLNIKIRKLYMKGAINPGVLPSLFYYGFLLLIPFRSLLNFGYCYRRLFYISIK